MIFILICSNLVLAAEFDYDLGINSDDINFSQRLIVGKNIRIYAAIHNYGNIDVAGYVSFFQGDKLIGDSQVVSVRAGGLADEVYVDWQVPSGSFNIRAVIKGQNPSDQNSSNDLAITPLIEPLFDFDEDGIPDEEDIDDDNDNVKDVNEPILGTDPLDSDSDDDGCLDGEDDFPLDSNECTDMDGDGIGDNNDNDDDNDGLSDSQEKTKNTDPNNPDTDNDGVIDSQDYAPLDSNIQHYSNNSKPQIQPNNTNQDNLNIIENEINKQDQDQEDMMVIKETDNTPINEMLVKSLIPKITIQQTQKNWNTFVFRPNLRGVIDNNLAYYWELGDGSISQQKVVEHQYAKSGNYQVSLKITGKNDLQISSQKNINISFFNLGNKSLIVIITLLILALLIFTFSIATGKREK